MWTSGWAFARQGEGNAEPVIAAVNQFKAEHGRLPGSLNELVLGHLGTIPCATLPWRETNEFWYYVIGLGPGKEPVARLCFRVGSNWDACFHFMDQTWRGQRSTD
ncbi:MAG: hypothetical protein AB1646_17845 [Thermodesulfobacteriota bacterium]